jgi:hypothetical protein
MANGFVHKTQCKYSLKTKAKAIRGIVAFGNSCGEGEKRVAEMCQEGCLGCVEEVVFQMCGCSQQLCDGCKLVQDGCMQRDEVNKYHDEQACLTEKKKKLTQVQKSLKKGGGGENEGGLEVGVGDAVRAGGESKQRLRQKTRQAHRQYLEEGACRVATHTAAE